MQLTSELYIPWCLYQITPLYGTYNDTDDIIEWFSADTSMTHRRGQRQSKSRSISKFSRSECCGHRWLMTGLSLEDHTTGVWVAHSSQERSSSGALRAVVRSDTTWWNSATKLLQRANTEHCHANHPTATVSNTLLYHILSHHYVL